MEYIIREMKLAEYPLLEDFLYEAIFQPDRRNLLPRSVINNPELRVYIENFGAQKDDHCLCAEADGKIVGAVWVRNIPGYGSVDDTTPEFAISLLEDCRGQGIGTALMRAMLAHLKAAGYEKASLAVQKANYALKMCLRVGFKIVGENEQEYIMVHDLQE